MLSITALPDALTYAMALLQAQPWWALVPLVGLGLSNGVLGYLTARKRGEAFSARRFADFMEHSIGAHQLAWVVGSVVLVALTQGVDAGWLSLAALAGVGSVAYLKVLADDVAKLRVLLGLTEPTPDTTLTRGI